MKLSEWILSEGGADRVARQLKVTRRAVDYWTVGHSCPNTETVFKIISLSKGKVSLEDILKEVKALHRERKNSR